MTDPYLHGTTAEEQERLALLNGAINRRCLAFVAPRVGERVLEVGAGTGVFARELAGAVGGTGSVLGIERDEEQLRTAEAGGGGVTYRRGDAYELPLEPDEVGTFDLVHARFLLEHLSDPARAVAQMVRAAADRGRVVLVDDDHTLMRFHPDVPEMDALWRAYYEAFAVHGQDPTIGRRLAGLLIGAGAAEVVTDTVQFGGCAQEPAFADLVTNLIGVVRSMEREVLATGDWTRERFDGAIDAFHEWSRSPDATITYPLPCAMGIVRS